MAEKVKSRSLTRRLAYVALSLATLSGGGWGVYHYTHSTDAPAARSATGQSSAAADELKHLFASESTATAKTAPFTQSDPATKPAAIPKTPLPQEYPPSSDRYGLSAKSSLHESAPVNPFASAPPVAEDETKPKVEPASKTVAANPVLVADRYDDRYSIAEESTSTPPEIGRASCRERV